MTPTAQTPVTTPMGEGALSRKLATVQGILARTGLRGVGFVVLQKALPHRWAHAEWYHLFETRDADAPAVTARWVSDAAAIAGLSELSGQEENPARLRDGHRVAVAYDGDTPVSYLWVHAGPEYTEEGVTFRLAPDELWMFDGFTRPSHRGRRFHPRLFHWIVGDLRPRRILSTIDVVNHASCQAAAARGAVRLATLFALRIGPFVVLCRDGTWTVSRHPVEVVVPG